MVKETKRIDKETETDWQTIWQSESRSSRQHVFVEESPRQVAAVNQGWSWKAAGSGAASQQA